jgi:hypothetical protein
MDFSASTDQSAPLLWVVMVFYGALSAVAIVAPVRRVLRSMINDFSRSRRHER